MLFDYPSYASLINLIRDSGYQFSLFQSDLDDKVVIMRHDVDVCLDKALAMAELEYELDVQATYFILVSGLYYNIFQLKAKQIMRKIASFGHEIGLHFDRTQCTEGEIEEIESWVDIE